MTIQIEDIRRLRLEPGDHLLIRLPDGTMMADLNAVRELFDSAWPDVPLIVLAGPLAEQMELDVVAKGAGL